MPGWPIDAICEHLEAVERGDIKRLLINVPPGFMKPVDVNAMVLTERGRIRLGDVVVGDRILTHRGRFQNVSAVHKQGELPLLRVTTFGGRKTITAPDHPYLTPRGWIQAADLTVGDVLGAVTPFEDPFTDQITIEESRFLGYMVGDGGCTHAPTFTNADPEVLADFRRCAESCGIRVREKPLPPSKPAGYKATIFSLVGAREIMSRHGILDATSYTKRIPPAVLGSSRAVIANFLGAYWSCDGQVVVRHTGTRGSIFVANTTTVGADLANDIQHALLRIGISARVRSMSRPLVTKRQPGGVYRYFNVQTVAHKDTVLFKDLPGLCSRKNAPLQSLVAQVFTQGPLFEDPIVSIEPAGSGECRCLTVDEDHSFTINDIAVHNSLICNVFFPAWVWGPRNRPSSRFIAASYSQKLTIRDNIRFRQIITSDLYREFWGDRFGPSKDTFTTIDVGNDKTGWKSASSVGGSVTGFRCDFFIIDDPNNVAEAESESIRSTTNDWMRETVPSRLNSAEDGAIIVIQQRVNEMDVSGLLIDLQMPYTHLCIPMEYDATRHCHTSIDWDDPRGLDDDGVPLVGAALDDADGILAWPERFPPQAVKDLAEALGPYAYAGQYQQLPAPRGGGIFKRDWWKKWPPDDWPMDQQTLFRAKFPDLSYVVASLDTAYTEDNENDYSALTIWGIWRSASVSKVAPAAMRAELMTDDTGTMFVSDENTPKIMLLFGWQKRLELHGPPEVRPPGLSDKEWGSRYWVDQRKSSWGLVEWVSYCCRLYAVDTLLIENKARGHDVGAELARLLGTQGFGIQMVDPRGQDKVARAHSIVHLFSNGVVYAPTDRDWCDQIVTQMSRFPRAKNDDLTDSAIYALAHLRDTRWALRREESEAELLDELRTPTRSAPLYPV